MIGDLLVSRFPRSKHCAVKVRPERNRTLFVCKFTSGFANGDWFCGVLTMEGNKGPGAQWKSWGQSPTGPCLSSERRRRTDDEAYWKGASRGVLTSVLRGRGSPVLCILQAGKIDQQVWCEARGLRQRQAPLIYALGDSTFSSAKIA